MLSHLREFIITCREANAPPYAFAPTVNQLPKYHSQALSITSPTASNATQTNIPPSLPQPPVRLAVGSGFELRVEDSGMLIDG